MSHRLRRHLTTLTIAPLVLGLIATLYVFVIPFAAADQPNTPLGENGFVTDLVVSTGKSYEVDTLAVRSRVYIDRAYSWTNIPARYANQLFIRSANDDKLADDAEFMRFFLAVPAVVYVAYDTRITPLPGWLDDGTWADMQDIIDTNDVPRRVYGKAFPAGPVVLGGNAATSPQSSAYNVIVIPSEQPDAPTAPAEPTATAEPIPAEPTATDAPADAPVSAELITDLVVANGNTYKIDTLVTGARAYIDRVYTFTDIPDPYEGQLFIRTANNDKSASDPDLVRFSLSAPATVYIAYDQRIQTLPGWLDDGSWQKTADTVAINEPDSPVRVLYARAFPSGPVVLGGNAAPTSRASNYTVIIVPGEQPDAPPATDPSPTATATAEPTADEPAAVEPTATATATAEPAPVEPTATATATTEPEDTQSVQPLDQVGTQWSPYLEWSLDNPSYSGNPFDLIASVTFVHAESGETRTTGMFYDGNDTWKFRFTGTRTGIWTFTTESDDPDLDAQNGTVTIEPNPTADLPGFIATEGDKWIYGATGEAFVPRFLMHSDPVHYYDNPGKIDADIQTFIGEHGFNGFHTQVYCRWFDLNTKGCNEINEADPNPDPRTFEALEMLITKTHAAGGVVHLWAWGDDQRGWNPKRWGLNGQQDQRVQRYIAARLGPLPGWSMGYGFDLHEWTSESVLTEWHAYMQEQSGWFHPLGGRASTNQLDQISESLDYSSYEQTRPDYAQFVAAIEARPGKPTFSEDRFRILSDPAAARHFSPDEIRRTLWRATMAGGVAAIYGNLQDGRASGDGSAPFPNRDQIKTVERFFEQRFTADLERCDDLTDGVCLQRPTNQHYIFYKEDTASIRMNLSGMAGAQRAIAIDTRQPYAEIDLGTLDAQDQAWDTPYESDWAIAVGF